MSGLRFDVSNYYGSHHHKLPHFLCDNRGAVPVEIADGYGDAERPPRRRRDHMVNDQILLGK